MANPEHLAILKKGVEAWNEWREQNRCVQPNLSEADLRGLNLVGANLKHAMLARAIFWETDLTEADLQGANLCEAELAAVPLDRANLKEAYMVRVDLFCAKLCAANLERASLRDGQLSRCDLTKAKLTGAKLYATARDDWIINGVECEYVFWDLTGKVRSPSDRDLAPGEFEQLYRALPTIEHIFQNGMTPLDPLIMDRVVQAIREQNPEYDIKIDSICARGLAPSIRFTVQQEEQKEPALQMIVAGYERRLRQLEGEKNRLYDLLALAIDKAGTKLLVAGRDIVNAEGNATINIEQHVENYITNLRDTIAALPEDSPTFGKVAKKTAMDIIGSALKDVAKGQVKEAAKQVYGLAKDLGPVALNMAADVLLRNMM